MLTTRKIKYEHCTKNTFSTTTTKEFDDQEWKRILLQKNQKNLFVISFIIMYLNNWIGFYILILNLGLYCRIKFQNG